MQFEKRMIGPKWLWLALLGIVLFTAGPLGRDERVQVES
jgi:hypothetical protein